MGRFIILFFILLTVSIGLMWALMAQNGLNLFSAEMAPMLLVCFLVAGYVSFRITGIISRRRNSLDRTARPVGAWASKLSSVFNQKSAAQLEREARVEAKRQKLIAEGKLEADPEPEPPPAEERSSPTRVSQSAPIKDRMAARAERVRRAKEQGKL
ncbi:MAG: hypothetical protein R3C13_09760 [Hyphomonas sp.]|uniref:hypothetical protein n=1 Tax=Hyphomonas sp. TaxID=87 RepID=UPI0035299C78